MEFSSCAGLAVLKKCGVSSTPLCPLLLLPKTISTPYETSWRGTPPTSIHNPIMGWGIKPYGVWQETYRANSKGIRGNREYPVDPPDGIIRISTFGDSFTHCDDVKNEDTWQEQLSSADPRLEVLNFGVGGYGLDQAFLRYKEEGITYHSHIVFIGFMDENIKRLVNIYRPFYYPGIPLTKPRFCIQGDNLVLLQNPLARLNDSRMLLSKPKEILDKLGKNDFHYQCSIKEGPFDFSPSVRLSKMGYHFVYQKYLELSDKSIFRKGFYNPESEAFKIGTKLFDEFYCTAQKNSSLPVIVLFPNKQDVERYLSHHIKIYAPLTQYFDSQGYRYIELLQAFDEYHTQSNVDNLFNGYHYSPLGNLIVAKFILNYLKENRLTNPRKKGVGS